MRRILTVCLLFLISPAWAAGDDSPLTLNDFAYGMKLSISGKGDDAIYDLPVPDQVYRGCTRPDLGDLRVFNSQGVVPHLLRPQVKTTNSPKPTFLPYFPLVGKTTSNGMPPNLRIAADSRGTIIDIRPEQKEQPSTVVTSYIIDTSGLQEQADWLEFRWSNQSDHFSTSVQIETSDDLNDWQPLIRSVALAELHFGGHDLVRNRIAMKKGMKKYLRLSWPPGKQGVVVTEIRAGYEREEKAPAHTVQALTGKPEPDDGQDKVVYHYTSDGFFPVDQISVRLPHHNSLAQVSVFSRADQEAPWRQRGSLLSYRLTLNGISIDSGVRSIAPTTDRFWRLEMEKFGSQSQAPALELGWRPQQLIFIAEGEGPYTLAYGRAGLKPHHSQVERLLVTIDPEEKNNLIMPAYAGPQALLGGENLLLFKPEIPWRRWFLWTGLVAGVLVIAGMALHLFKEMKKEATPKNGK